jgi:hypothetical protein
MRCNRTKHAEARLHLHVDHAVCLEDVEQLLLALGEEEAGVLGEGAMDVTEDYILYLLLPQRHLQQRVVPASRQPHLLQTPP